MVESKQNPKSFKLCGAQLNSAGETSRTACTRWRRIKAKCQNSELSAPVVEDCHHQEANAVPKPTENSCLLIQSHKPNPKPWSSLNHTPIAVRRSQFSRDSIKCSITSSSPLLATGQLSPATFAKFRSHDADGLHQCRHWKLQIESICVEFTVEFHGTVNSQLLQWPYARSVDSFSCSGVNPISTCHLALHVATFPRFDLAVHLPPLITHRGINLFDEIAAKDDLIWFSSCETIWISATVLICSCCVSLRTFDQVVSRARRCCGTLH